MPAAHALRSTVLRAIPRPKFTPQPQNRQRAFSSTSRSHFGRQKPHRKETFASRLGRAWRRTPIKWKPIPIGLGIAFLGVFQFARIQERERRKQELEWIREHHENSENGSDDEGPLPKREKRKRTRPSGPWTVQIMSTLPLKFMSRLWGKCNEIQIPYYLRVPGFKLYGFIFGVNFDEVAEPDLHQYRNLAEFFYRTLKPGVRPLDPHPNALLSPADGRVIQCGYIEHGEVEQVKGVTYSVDALLGAPGNGNDKQKSSSSNVAVSPSSPQPSHERRKESDSDGDSANEVVKADEEFARVNGISYTLPNLFSGDVSNKPVRHREGGLTSSKTSTSNKSASDQSTSSTSTSEAEVQSALATSPSASRPWYYPDRGAEDVPMGLYYCVVYLAPGDYHRFHSPVSWVVETRRHFAGELYSVSPYLQRTLPGLFTLNERVVLLGRWKYGFFSYTPVGATNVGSIIINFDRELRTNSLLTDTLADRAAAEAQRKGEPYSGYAEATYASSSPVLGGHALRRGEEMGGFQLGSTIVMVFEAPKGVRPSFDEGWMVDEKGRRGGWRWCVEKGSRVRVGERLGFVEDEGVAVGGEGKG